VNFQLEQFDKIMEEVIPLFQQHYLEIAHYADIELSPDFERYVYLSSCGAMKCYTYREGETLIGYAFFFIKHNMHYSKSLQAVQDIIFIQKDKRGHGSAFISWCDEQLKDLGVQVVYHHIKTNHNWGSMLERKGYELVDLIYAKRLDGEG